MNINKLHYKVLTEPKKIYLNMTTLEIREKLNVSFKNPTVEDDMTGIFGKYYKLDKMFKVKYIYKRNNQLQPLTFDRYHYLVDVGEDEKGTFIEYAMVYDKLFDPLIRLTYILAACAIISYLFYLFTTETMQQSTTIVMSCIILLSSVLVFKKAKETQEECSKAEDLFIKFINNL